MELQGLQGYNNLNFSTYYLCGISCYIGGCWLNAYIFGHVQVVTLMARTLYRLTYKVHYTEDSMYKLHFIAHTLPIQFCVYNLVSKFKIC